MPCAGMTGYRRGAGIITTMNIKPRRVHAFTHDEDGHLVKIHELTPEVEVIPYVPIRPPHRGCFGIYDCDVLCGDVRHEFTLKAVSLTTLMGKFRDAPVTFRLDARREKIAYNTHYTKKVADMLYPLARIRPLDQDAFEELFGRYALVGTLGWFDPPLRRIPPLSR